MKKQPTVGKIFVKYMNKRLIFKIYNELVQLNSKKNNKKNPK